VLVLLPIITTKSHLIPKPTQEDLLQATLQTIAAVRSVIAAVLHQGVIAAPHIPEDLTAVLHPQPIAVILYHRAIAE